MKCRYIIAGVQTELSMSDLVDILKVSGPLSLMTLTKRTPGTPASLVEELKNLHKKGIVEITGPLADALPVDRLMTEEARHTTVQLKDKAF